MKLNITKFPQKVGVRTTRSTSFGYVGYNATTFLTNIGTTVNGTKTFSDFATDGTHIWIRANNKTTVKYNGETCTFSRNGNYFMITIPDNYDPSIPFDF